MVPGGGTRDRVVGQCLEATGLVQVRGAGAGTKAGAVSMVTRRGFERHPKTDTSTGILPSLQSPIQTPSPPCSFPDFLHTHNNNGFFALCPQNIDISIKPIITFCPVLEESNLPLFPLSTP